MASTNAAASGRQRCRGGRKEEISDWFCTKNKKAGSRIWEQAQLHIRTDPSSSPYRKINTCANFSTMSRPIRTNSNYRQGIITMMMLLWWGGSSNGSPKDAFFKIAANENTDSVNRPVLFVLRRMSHLAEPSFSNRFSNKDPAPTELTLLRLVDGDGNQVLGHLPPDIWNRIFLQRRWWKREISFVLTCTRS